MTRYRITIDPTLCSGLGACLEHAPGAIALGRDGIAHATTAESEDDGVLEAATACPMGAIAILEAATGRWVA